MIPPLKTCHPGVTAVTIVKCCAADKLVFLDVIDALNGLAEFTRQSDGIFGNIKTVHLLRNIGVLSDRKGCCDVFVEKL